MQQRQKLINSPPKQRHVQRLWRSSFDPGVQYLARDERREARRSATTAPSMFPLHGFRSQSVNLHASANLLHLLQKARHLAARPQVPRQASAIDLVGQCPYVQANARDHVGSNNFRSSCTSIGRLHGERSPLTSGNYDQLRRQRRGPDH